MVAVYGISILKPPFFLETHLNVSSFSFFSRGTVKQMITFFMRQVAKRTEPGEKKICEEGEFVCHCWTPGSGELCVAVVTDKEYPSRVAFHLGTLSLKAFCTDHQPESYMDTEQDLALSTPSIEDFFKTYQQPDYDQIFRIKKDLDDVKNILSINIDQLLQRGEALETLISQSEDLNDASKQFLRSAKIQNSCCGTRFF